MKQLTCEMCGSTDLMRQDGVFVCQTCGTKYSVEDAKKMMVEGTVDVSGSTIKVDNTDELANLYQIARRAKNDNNAENAAKYYDMILVKDPTSWEAAFYVVYFQAANCTIGQIRNAAISVSNCESSVLSLIKKTVQPDQQIAAVTEIVERSCTIASILNKEARIHKQGSDAVIATTDILYTCRSMIESIFENDPQMGKLAAQAIKKGIEIHQDSLMYYYQREHEEAKIDTYAAIVAKYFPDYQQPYYQKKRQLEELERQAKRIEEPVISLKTEINYLHATIQNGKGWTCNKDASYLVIFLLIEIAVTLFYTISVVLWVGWPGISWLFLIFQLLMIIIISVKIIQVTKPFSEDKIQAKKKEIEVLTAELKEKQAELEKKQAEIKELKESITTN